MKQLVSAFILFCLASTALAQTTYYIDSANGNDSWVGTLGDPNTQSTNGPWRTLAKVNASKFSPGDSILFKCGSTWWETLYVSSSGTTGSPITFGQYGTCNSNNKPAIHPVDVVKSTAWTQYKGNIYSTPVSYPVQQVMMDGVTMSLAHYPNRQAGKSFLPLIDSPDLRTLVAGPELGVSACNSFNQTSIAGGTPTVHVRVNDYVIDERTVSSCTSSGSNYILTLTNDISSPTGAGWGFYLDNMLWMLDSPGEWFSNGSLLYVWVPNGQTPASHVVELMHYDNNGRNYGIVAIRDQVGPLHDVIISNIAISGADVGVTLTQSGTGAMPSNVVLDSLSVTNSKTSGIDAWSTSNARINNCVISNSGRQSIYAQNAVNLSITNNTITNGGVTVDSVGNITSQPTSSRASINTTDSSATIKNNVVINSPLDGIEFGPNTTITNNVIENTCLVLDDCGAISTYNGNDPNPLSPKPYNSTIAANVILNSNGNSDGRPVTRGSSAHGIYLDNLTSGVQIIGNTVIGSDDSIKIHQSPNNVLRGNVLYGARGTAVLFEENNFPGSVHDNTASGNIEFPGNMRAPTKLLGHNGELGPTARNVFDANVYNGLYSDFVVRDIFSLNDKSLNLSQWQIAHGMDTTGIQYKPFSIRPYRIVSENSVNFVANGSFDSDSIGAWKSGGGTTLARANCDAGNPCLKFTASGTSLTGNYLYLPLPGVTFDPAKTYLVRFKMKANIENVNLSAGLTTLTQALAPYQTVTVNSEWAVYSLLYKPTQLAANARLIVQNAPLGSELYVDNVSLTEVSVAVHTDLSDDTRILVNKTQVPQDMNCPDTDPARCSAYIDLSGNVVSWPVRLAPYTSEIIVWSANPFRDADMDGVTDAQDACPHTTHIVDTNNAGCAPTDIAIGLSAAPTASVGGTIQYTATVTNNGPDEAGAVTPKLYFPTGLTPGSATAGQGTCTIAGTTVSCPLGALANGATATVTVAASANAGGTYYVSANFTAAGADTNPLNNSALVSTVVGGASIDLGISAGTNSNSPTVGSNMVYTLVVRNNGPSPATNVSVSDDLGGASFVQSGSSTNCSGSGPVTCTVGNLASQASATLTVVVTPKVAGTLSNIVTVAGTEADANSANNSATTTTIVQSNAAVPTTAADLVPLSLTAGISTSQLVITDSVKNIGTGAAGAFNVSYYLSSDTTYQAASNIFICKRNVAGLAAGAPNPATGTVQTTCAIPSTTAGAYYVVEMVDSDGSVSESSKTNNARATSSTVSIAAMQTPKRLKGINRMGRMTINSAPMPIAPVLPSPISTSPPLPRTGTGTYTTPAPIPTPTPALHPSKGPRKRIIGGSRR